MHYLEIFGQKQCFFGSKTVFLGQEVHYYMVYIAYFTELNLQICNNVQKRGICRKNCKHALDENFHCQFCSRRKASKFCHPASAIYCMPSSSIIFSKIFSKVFWLILGIFHAKSVRDIFKVFSKIFYMVFWLTLGIFHVEYIQQYDSSTSFSTPPFAFKHEHNVFWKEKYLPHVLHIPGVCAGVPCQM